MDPIRIKILIVSTDEQISYRSYSILKQMLEDFFISTLPRTLQHVTVSYFQIKGNVYQLEENIISTVDSNTADMILIFDLALKQNVITKIINKITDKENTIGKVFAKMPAYLKETNFKSLKFACRNNKLIFSMTGNHTGITKIVQTFVDTMILATHLLRIVIRQCNILNRSQVKEEKILRTQHISSPSALELSASNTNKNKNDQAERDITTNQETCQSIVSIEKALNTIEILIIEDIIIVPVEKECIHISDAFGRITYEEVKCRSNVPPFLTAAKRGYAVRVIKEKENQIKMKDESSKISPIILDPNTSVWVDKGDYIPLETNAIIPAKNVISSRNDEGMLINTTTHTIKCSENTRLRGSDIKKNDIIIEAFTCIGSTEMSFLTACGCKEINVYKKLSIGVLTVGNKLQEPGEPLKLEHSYDSNRAILISLLKEQFHDIYSMDFGITSKNTTCIVKNITAALENVDVLVTTGCSSDKDCLKAILKQHFKAIFYFENVNIKPGKSTAFASCNFKDKTKIIFCLPGNPASVFLTTYLLLFPSVNFIFYNFNKEYPMMQVQLEQELLLHSRPRYVWATLSWECASGDIKPRAKITNKETNSISNKLSDIENANALLILPSKTPERSTMKAESPVLAMLIKFPNF